MNSVLNPEAPEFHPNWTSVTQDGFSTVNKTIRSSNHFPTGVSYDLFKAFTDFNVVTCQFRENVVEQSNQIVATELPAVKLKCNDDEYNTEKIIDANDSMLDRVFINIDTLSGVNQPSEKFLEGIKQGVNVASWNKQNAPIIAKIQVGSTTFIGAKNIPRPQLTFKEPIDNSENLWVPKISDKPNSIKPLALNILYNDEGEAVGYEHPYQVELEVYQPPESALQAEGDPVLPPPLERTPFTLVETEQQLDALVEHLLLVDQLAVDVEHHSYRTYQGITCLIQITTDEGGDFIIDALAVREHVHKLNLVFTDPKKIKVFHGAEWDVVWLQRDFGVYIVGLFDTHQAAKALKLNGLSLKYLLYKYCGVNADKKYQLADWRIRPLPEELVSYARLDTHYLLFTWRRLRAELLAAAAGSPRLLRAVFEQSRHICLTTYNKEVIDENSHMKLYVRSKKSFNARQMAALRLLYRWRDAQARALDESTAYLLPNHMVVSLAEALPRELQGVSACCNPTPPFVKQNLVAIHRMILSCRELPPEQHLYQPAPPRPAPPRPARAVHDLAHAPRLSEEPQVDVERGTRLLLESPGWRPEVPAFAPDSRKSVSGLNVDAQLFVPPYDRYRTYRSLAQLEELKEYKDKEAKITAISKGNELIKSEVLIKIQQAKTHVENKEGIAKGSEEDNSMLKIIDEPKRKRKITMDKLEKGVQLQPRATKSSERSRALKPFLYKNLNYRKFYDDAEKEHKHPKMKFKKHK